MGSAEKPFFLSSIGKKYIMGLTGVVWAGFVFAHMLGNMLIFVSADAYNLYGHALTSGYFIYVAEAVLVSALIVHVLCAISLTIENRKARGDTRYAVSPKGQKAPSLASQTMAIHGTMILFFIISHLVTFKYGTHYSTYVRGEEIRDLYKLLFEVFQQPAYLAWYILCLGLLFFHLKHGVASIIQSFGILSDKIKERVQKIAFIYAVVVIGGFLSQPIYVFLLK